MFVVVQLPTPTGHERVYIECEPTMSLAELKEKINGQKNIPPKLQKLRCDGILMADDCSLEMYGIVAQGGGTASQLINLEVIIAGPVPLEESALLDAIWDQAGGPSWKRNVGWEHRLLHPEHARGITVREQHIHSISMPDNNLRQRLPREIASCSRLVELNLGYNLLEGALPAELGRCSALVRLNLQWNRFRGAIPPELFSGLTRLQFLYLDHNQLSGELPNTVGECRSLTRLSVANNLLQGRLPYSLGLLDKLNVLWLMHNPDLVVPYQVKLFSPAQEILKYYRWDRVEKRKGWLDR